MANVKTISALLAQRRKDCTAIILPRTSADLVGYYYAGDTNITNVQGALDLIFEGGIGTGTGSSSDKTVCASLTLAEGIEAGDTIEVPERYIPGTMEVFHLGLRLVPGINYLEGEAGEDGYCGTITAGYGIPEGTTLAFTIHGSATGFVMADMTLEEDIEAGTQIDCPLRFEASTLEVFYMGLRLTPNVHYSVAESEDSTFSSALTPNFNMKAGTSLAFTAHNGYVL